MLRVAVAAALVGLCSAVFAGAGEYTRYVDPMIGTEGVGSDYGGMTPMTGVPFGSMHLVPMTRMNGVGAANYNALDKKLLGFTLSRQPAIWMGEFGAVRVMLAEPAEIESVTATPYLTVVKAGGKTYELTASSHLAYIRTDDEELGRDLADHGLTSERTARVSTQPMPSFGCSWSKRREGKVLKIAVSLVGESERNFEELPADFDAAAAQVKAVWEEHLSRFAIVAPEDVKTIFYTGIYHALLYPRDLSEHGKYYSAFDDRIHEGAGYSCFSLWDTYRAEHPLLTLIVPERIDAMMQSLVNMGKEGGYLPMWPNPGYTGIMNADPAAIVLAEAYAKGFRGFDAEAALELMVRNASVPQQGDLERNWDGDAGDDTRAPEVRGGLTTYLERGYVDCERTIESVSRTLDYSLADEAIARLAAALGKEELAAEYERRGRNYTNLWNAAVKKFMPRNAAGDFVRPSYDWRYRCYTETDEDSARWCVPHDAYGLIRLMGGWEAFERELDKFFDQEFFRRDVIGHNSVHGNETCHHTAYLYHFIGKPEKSAQRVTEILKRCYSTNRRGYEGNEDCGQMSAWYVMSALGIYSVDTSCGMYELVPPYVESAKLRLGEKTLVIRKEGEGILRPYLNGQPIDCGRVTHQALAAGGELVWRALPTVYPTPKWLSFKGGEVDANTDITVVDEPHPEKGAYTIRVSEDGVTIGCADSTGEFYARQTLAQLERDGKYQCCEVSDWPDIPRRGVVEGFYGPPWSADGRVKLMDFMGRNKMNLYIYGPKDDPYHHVKWREPYPAEKLEEFKRILAAAKANHVDFCWAIHLADAFTRRNDAAVAAEKAALYAKLDSLYDIGFRAFAVFFDDFGGEYAAKHSRICNGIVTDYLERKGDCARLVVCPNVYTGFGDNDYCEVIGAMMCPEVDLMWTGEYVCSELPAEHAERVSKSYRRAPFVWWNWPVNDYQTTNLQLGQAYGVEKYGYAGFVSNPMHYLEASKIALFGVADITWNVNGHEPMKCWRDGIRRMFPTCAEAMRRFADYNSDPNNNNTGIGSWVRNESLDFRPENLVAECERNLAAAETLERELPKRHPELWKEIKYWVLTFGNQAHEGIVAAKRDKAGFVKARERREKLAQEHIAYVKSTTPEWFHGNASKPLTGTRRLQPAIDAIGRAMIGADRALYAKCYPEPGEMLGTLDAIAAKGVHLESGGILLVMNVLFEQVEAKPGDWFGISSKKPIQRVWAAFDNAAPKAGVFEASTDNGVTWEPIPLEFSGDNIYRGPVDQAKKYNAVRWRNVTEKPIRFKLPRFNVDI